MTRLIKRLACNQKGTAVIEYALIAALVSTMAGMGAMGDSLEAMYDGIVNASDAQAEDTGEKGKKGNK